MPSIPERRFNIGIPSEYGNTIEVLNYNVSEKTGKLIPLPKLVKQNGLPVPEYSIDENYFKYTPHNSLVTFGESGLVRDLLVQTIRIFPVEFDPLTNTIKLYTKILFRINYSSQQQISSEAADEFIAEAVLNYQTAKNWKIESRKNSLDKIQTNSVLSSGKWVRFEAPEEGIYRITRSMLPSFGIDPNTVDPRTIKIYNNGGKMLPEKVVPPRPVDLIENTILIVGEDDGKFDENDYILFYGRGNHFWDYDTSAKKISRYFHLYSNENYYWITSGGEQGRRIQNKPGLNQASYYLQPSTKAFAAWEEDKINLGKTGRIFLGQDFTPSKNSNSFPPIKLDGRIESSPIRYRIRFINGSADPFTLQVTENTLQIHSQLLLGYGGSSYITGIEHTIETSFNGVLPENRSVAGMKITTTSITNAGYLDFYELYYEKELKAFNDFLLFFSKDTSAVLQYNLNGFSSTNIMVFDVSDFSEVKLISNPIMHSGGEYRFQIQESENKISKYIGIANNNFKSPSNPVEVPNSNLRGITDGAKFIIITHKNFKDAAIRLKNYRQNESKVTLSTIVVDVDEIFNEFGGGLRDVTAMRDFIKYAYDTWTIKPQYVLLFGVGTYDFKNVEGYGTNFIPTWQTEEYLILASINRGSFTSDDFFVKVSGDDPMVDLAIGRITAQSAAEANTAVDKIIYYEQESDMGVWRNLITLVSDDGVTSQTQFEGAEHTRPNENLANSIIPKSFDFNKIYLAAYPVELTSAGRRKPAVNRAIIDAFNNGTLVMNFIGHGSPELWTHEVVYEKSVTVPQLKNNRYLFLTAATCDFGYFDIPNFQSANDVMLLKKDGGTIASFTSSRLVYSTQNQLLMYQFFADLFNTPRDTLNLSIPIGKASFLTKQSFYSVNDQKYFIFGDPTLRLLIPQYTASIDSINGQYVTVGSAGGNSSSDIQLQALSTVRINGVIKDTDNNVWEDFSGEGILAVFDSERTVLLTEINNYPMTIQGGVIFRGRISVINGKFNADFVVPKDISYENKNGKIIIYFFNQESDGLGFTSNIIIGGTDSTAVDDGKGPEIEIYFDDASFENAYLVAPNTTLIAKLYDQTGLNTTGTGIGHKLEGLMNDQINNPIDFTNYFIGDMDAGGKSGRIEYKFNRLEERDHKIEIKAWDVFNNFSKETAYFTVVSGDDLVIRDIYNYPNPFSNSTTFTFQQNLNRVIDVQIKIYTVAGRLIKEIEKNSISDKFVKIDWDGRDADGNQIANGAYLYKIIVKTLDGEYNRSVLGKLAVVK
jgi:hypothetical protein